MTRGIPIGIGRSPVGIERSSCGVVLRMPYDVYIMTSRPLGALYMGDTNGVVRRACERGEGLMDSLTKR